MATKQNNNKNKIKSHQDLFVISLLTLLAVAAWIGSNAYHHFVAKQAITVPENLLTPLDPKINMEVISRLEEKKSLSEEEIEQILGSVPAGEATPSPQTKITPSLTPSMEAETANSSAEISPSPTPYLPQGASPTENTESLNWPHHQKEKGRLL